MRLQTQIELLKGSRELLTNWRELFVYGLLLRKYGVHVNPPAPLRFRSGLEIGLVSGGYGGYNILFHEIFLRKDYQPTPDFVVRDGWTVLDIGANMGLFTLQAATAAKDVKVVAVEPLPDYVEVLRGNLLRNRLEQSVTVLQAAATDKPGMSIPMTVWFTKAGELKTGSPRRNVRTEESVAIGMSMAQIFETGKIDRCDLLKVDIEGAEYALFESTPNEIWNRSDRIVMETHEVNGHKAGDIAALLRRKNFQVSQRDNLLWAIKRRATAAAACR